MRSNATSTQVTMNTIEHRQLFLRILFWAYAIKTFLWHSSNSVLSNANSRVPVVRNAVWTLSNLCRGKDPPADFSQVVKGLPILARLLLFHTDVDVLSDTCWAISYLSDGPNDKIQAVIDAGICRRLVELLM